MAKRIVVADDEADIRDYFRKILPRLGFEVAATVRNGRELVASCREERPDLVITDVRMPELDGLRAAAELYEERHVPIVVMSAHDSLESIRQAGTNHIVGFLNKPIRQAELKGVLERVFGGG